MPMLTETIHLLNEKNHNLLFSVTSIIIETPTALPEQDRYHLIPSLPTIRQNILISPSYSNGCRIGQDSIPTSILHNSDEGRGIQAIIQSWSKHPHPIPITIRSWKTHFFRTPLTLHKNDNDLIALITSNIAMQNL